MTEHVPVINSAIPWNMINVPDREEPPMNTPLYVLVEEDTVDPDAYPGLFLVSLENHPEPYADGSPRRRWRLLDYDPQFEEEYLQQYHTVIAWRRHKMSSANGPWSV